MARPHLPIDASNSEASPATLDQVAGQRRYTGSLTEPLSDSVLQYTLRNLRSTVKSPQSAIGTDNLSQLLDTEFSTVASALRQPGDGSMGSSAGWYPTTQIGPYPSATTPEAQGAVNFPELQFASAFDALPYSIEDVQQPAAWGDPLTNLYWTF